MAVRKEYVAFVAGTDDRRVGLRTLVSQHQGMAYVQTLNGQDVYLVKSEAVRLFRALVVQGGCSLAGVG